MKIKDVIELYENFDRSDESLESFLETSSSVGEYMNDMAIEGKKIILNRIKEEDFCTFSNITRAVLLSSMIMKGYGNQLTFAEIDGDLKMYTDTVILTLLGVLADEEVI